MTVAVRYYCPQYEAVVALERDAYLDDKSVTPFPLEGWAYVGPDDDYDAEDVDADGVRFVCGAFEGFEGFEDDGCGEPFYLNFIRFVDGREIDPAHESDYVEINAGTAPPAPNGQGTPGSGGR